MKGAACAGTRTTGSAVTEPPGPGPSAFPDSGGSDFNATDPLISADYGGWWRRTTAVITRVWPQLLVLQAIGAAISLLCGVAVSRLGGPFMVESDQVQVLDAVVQAAAQTAAVLIDVTVFTLVTLAVVHLVVLTAAGRQPTLGACLRGAARRLLPLTGWSVLAGVMIAVGLLLCLLPGIYFIVVLLLLAPVIAIERRQGIGRCFELFHAGRSIALNRNGTILAITLAVITLGSLLEPPITAAVGSTQTDPTAGTSILVLAVGSVITAATGILTGPLTVTAYADLRASREPLSTAILAEQLLRP